MKKRILLTAGIAAIMACLFAATASAADAVSRQTTGDVNMRTGPGTSYGILCVVPNGSTISVAEVSDGWCYATYGSNQGWVSAKYVANVTPAASSAVTYNGSALVTTANVNLRTGPGTNYDVKLVVPNGSTVNVYEVENGWAHCTYDKYAGYLSAQYIAWPKQDPGITVDASGSAPVAQPSTPAQSGGSITISASADGSSVSFPASSSSGTTWYGGSNYANVYNYDFYRVHNQDVVAALGNNPDALIQHFVNYGMSEGRQASVEFNVYEYRKEHPDLEDRFGDDLRSYYLYACGLK